MISARKVKKGLLACRQIFYKRKEEKTSKTDDICSKPREKMKLANKSRQVIASWRQRDVKERRTLTRACEDFFPSSPSCFYFHVYTSSSSSTLLHRPSTSITENKSITHLGNECSRIMEVKKKETGETTLTWRNNIILVYIYIFYYYYFKEYYIRI